MKLKIITLSSLVWPLETLERVHSAGVELVVEDKRDVEIVTEGEDVEDGTDDDDDVTVWFAVEGKTG